MESVYSAKKYVESVIYTLLPFKVHSETSRHVCCKSDMWGVYGNTPSMLVRVAGLSGAAAVALAAYGTHVTHGDPLVDDRRKRSLENANKQHFLHSIALLLANKSKYPRVTAALFAVGIVCFCGPCYYYALCDDSRFRKVAPVGGVLFILGWLSFAL